MPGKVVHAFLDNYAVRKHPKVRAWLHRHPPFTYLLLLAERGRKGRRQLSRRRLKSGTFPSIIDSPGLHRFLEENNLGPKPFTWTADPDKIIAVVTGGHQVLDSIHELPPGPHHGGL